MNNNKKKNSFLLKPTSKLNKTLEIEQPYPSKDKLTPEQISQSQMLSPSPSKNDGFVSRIS